jgi:hypothetical protein
MPVNKRLPIKQKAGWDQSLINTLIASVIVVIGWPASIYIQNENRKNEIINSYLIEAYQDLALSSNRVLTPEYAKMMETAVAKIQLYGNAEDVAAVHEFLKEWHKQYPDGKARGDLNPILFTLRNSLRKNLELPPLQGEDAKIHWFRPLGGVD